LPANATVAQMPDNEYIGNIYRQMNVAPTANGKPIRIITSSWGSQPSTENFNTLASLTSAWRNLYLPDGVPDGNGKTVHWIHGALEAAMTGTVFQAFTAGNGGYANQSARRGSYFRRSSKENGTRHLQVSTTGQTFNADGSILVPGRQNFNQCGVAKWACLTAPGNAINSTTVSVQAGVPTATYGSSSGTSMAGPHSAAALALIMQRFPYMTNEQALYTMFTTARQNDQINNAAGTAISNPGKGTMVQVPDNRNGWGTVNLKDAFRGPAQLLGRFAVNTQGFNDVWSNDISNVAMVARSAEDDAEAAVWSETKSARGWNNGLAPGASAIDVSDFAIGTSREAGRNARVYTGSLAKSGSGTLFLGGNVNVLGADRRRRQVVDRG
jgi:subtilase-type serine protease